MELFGHDSGIILYMINGESAFNQMKAFVRGAANLFCATSHLNELNGKYMIRYIE